MHDAGLEGEGAEVNSIAAAPYWMHIPGRQSMPPPKRFW